MGEGATYSSVIARSKWKAWDDFVEANSTSGFRQSSWYVAHKEIYNGWDHFENILKDGESIVGGAVVFKKYFSPSKCYYYVPDGPVLLSSDTLAEQAQVFKALMQAIDSRRQTDQEAVSHICLNPRWEDIPDFLTGFQAAEHYYGTPRDTLIVQLAPAEADILAQMKPKGRYNIGVAKRHGVSIVEDNTGTGIADFIHIYQGTCARKCIGAQDDDYFDELLSILLKKNSCSIFLAEHEGKRIAAALVVYFAGTATYYYGGSLPICRNVMAPYLLHFEAMRTAKARGCLRYDFFGVSPQGEPDNSWADISVFKRKFGGQELRLVPTLEHIYDASTYDEWRTKEQERRLRRRNRRKLMEGILAPESMT